ncbi:MAG: hypothetical protein M0Z79_02520 [Nitrospiraceae bacterium]|nr:hypothetical protein [Nitrospiraceae bacterium]
MEVAAPSAAAIRMKLSHNDLAEIIAGIGLLGLSLIMIFGKAIDFLFRNKDEDPSVIKKRKLWWGLFTLFWAIFAFLGVIFHWPTINPKW